MLSTHAIASPYTGRSVFSLPDPPVIHYDLLSAVANLTAMFVEWIAEQSRVKAEYIALWCAGVQDRWGRCGFPYLHHVWLVGQAVSDPSEGGQRRSQVVLPQKACPRGTVY